MRQTALALAGLAAVATLSGAAASQAGKAASDPLPVTISATGFARSVFNGFGFSMVSGTIEDEVYAPAKHNIMKNLVEDLNTKILRLWWSEDYPRNPVWDQTFIDGFIKSGMVADFKTHGVESLLLAPDGPKSTEVEHQAMDVANFINELALQYNVTIDVTGIGNEPGAWNDTDVVTVTKVVAQNLTAFGLTDVKIIAPEWASQDGTGLARVHACKNDTKCWTVLHGIAGHSYNMAATDDWDETILAPGVAGPPSKSYWVTEAGYGGPWNVSGVAMAARMMNDLNHLVDSWVWFIGAEQHDPHPTQDGMRIIITWPNGTAADAGSWPDYQAAVADPTKPWPLYTRTPTWSYAHQLNQAFRPGASIRGCTANATHGGGGGPSMTWSFGLKEAFNAVVGRNADGTWAIALANPSGILPPNKYASYAPENSFRMTVDIPELAKMDSVSFKAVLSVSDTTLEQPVPDVVMRQGLITVDVPPNALITLVAEST